MSGGAQIEGGRAPTRLETEIHHLESTRAQLNEVSVRLGTMLSNLRGVEPPAPATDRESEVDPAAVLDRLSKVGADITNLTEKLSRQTNELGDLV